MKDNNLILPLHNHKNRRELKLLRADKPEMLIEQILLIFLQAME